MSLNLVSVYHRGQVVDPWYSVQPPRIHLRLPPDAAAEDEPEQNQGESSTSANQVRPGKRRKYDTRGIPDEYEVQVPNNRAKNTFVFQEKKRDWALGQDGRKRRKERGESQAALSLQQGIHPMGRSVGRLTDLSGAKVASICCARGSYQTNEQRQVSKDPRAKASRE